MVYFLQEIQYNKLDWSEQQVFSLNLIWNVKFSWYEAAHMKDLIKFQGFFQKKLSLRLEFT